MEPINRANCSATSWTIITKNITGTNWRFIKCLISSKVGLQSIRPSLSSINEKLIASIMMKQLLNKILQSVRKGSIFLGERIQKLASSVKCSSWNWETHLLWYTSPKQRELLQWPGATLEWSGTRTIWSFMEEETMKCSHLSSTLCISLIYKLIIGLKWEDKSLHTVIPIPWALIMERSWFSEAREWKDSVKMYSWCPLKK